MRTGASNIAGELQRLMGRVRTLTSSWTGTAASSFDGYYEQFNTSWSQCEQALNGISDLLNTSAATYADTEAGGRPVPGLARPSTPDPWQPPWPR